MSNTAPSRADPVVVLPLGRWSVRERAHYFKKNFNYQISLDLHQQIGNTIFKTHNMTVINRHIAFIAKQGMHPNV